ncbi:ATP-binding protein [Streptomyces capillispiralis]|uniref:ATP-binding protein n=1 Tax=Streptomyces capillispiralis TaxID=68182 RepID=UPI0036C60E7A
MTTIPPDRTAAPYPLRGRDEETGLMDRELREVAGGTARMVLVEGDAGMGKTAFARRVRERAQAAGFAVGASAAAENDRDTPLATLGPALRSATPAALLTVDDLTALLPLVEQPLWFVEQLASLIRRHVPNQPLLMSLDDFHWADPLTVFALRILPARLADLPLLWVLSARPGAGGPAEAVGAAADARLPVRRMSLGPLDDDAVLAIARDRRGAGTDDTIAARMSEARGVPFLAVHLAEGLLPRGAEASGSGGVPAGLIEGVHRRIAPASALGRSLMHVGSVLGTSFTITDAARVLDMPVAGLGSPLEEAVSTGLLIDDGDQVRFTHDLIRRAVYERLTPSIRRDMHRTAADHLLRGAGGAVRAAPHVLAAAAPGDTQSVRILRDAAFALLDTMAVTSATIIRQAYDLAGDDAALRAAVGRDALEIMLRARKRAEAEVFADALLKDTEDPGTAADVRLLLAPELWGAGRVEALRRLARDVPGAPPGPRRRLAAYRFLTGQDQPPDGDDPVARAVVAVAEAERAERSGAYARALVGYTRALHVGEEHGGEPGRLPPGVLRLRSLSLRAVLGEGQEVLTGLTSGPDGALPPDSWSAARHALVRAQIQFRAGLLEDAGASAVRCLALAEELDDQVVTPQARQVLAALAALRGDAARAREHIDALPEGRSRTAAAALLADTLDLPGAPAGLLRAATRAPALWRDELLVRAACSAHRAGDLPTVREAAERLEELLRLNPGAPGLEGAAALAHGLLTGDLGRARRVLAGARRPLLGALADEGWARTALPTARDEAVEALRQALSVYTGAQALQPAARVRGALASAGVRRAGRGPGRTRPVSGWDALTPAERKVAWLVAQGHTNRATARELFVSPSTVATHLRSVFAKLGVDSRVRLTRLVLALPGAAPQGREVP